MSSEPPARRDFFISFNRADRAWAEWIAYELEEAGYTTFFQHWDFSPGSNFVLEMHAAASLADRTIAVLSQDYLDAIFTQPEWSAALVQDPTGAKRTLIPVRVQPCQPRGMLAPIVYADIVDLGEEAAREKLLSLAEGGRPKPKHVSFPGGKTDLAAKKEFPGARTSGAPPRKVPKESAGTQRRAEPPPAPPSGKHPAAPLPLVWFVLALIGAVMVIAFGEKLVGFGLVNQIYYVVLVALGLGAAGALFAGVRSVAESQGKKSWGTLKLSGPPVVFCLVVGAGMVFSPGQKPFGLTVYVHGPAGPQDLVLRNQGQVAIDLGPDRRIEQIGDKGTAFFAGIPPDFRGKSIPVSVIADGFARANGATLPVTGESLYVPIRKRATLLIGVILDEARDPIPNATVEVAGQTAKANASGRFELPIPGELVKPEMTMDVRADGFTSQTHAVVPNSNEIRLSLKKRPGK